MLCFLRNEGNIIATGGGIIKSEENMKLLGENGIILYLNATPEHIYNNLAEDDTRPLLQGEDKLSRIQSLMEERRPLYEEYADITVLVSQGNVNDITETIAKELELYDEKNMRDTRSQS